jgi:hypothetical protein
MLMQFDFEVHLIVLNHLCLMFYWLFIAILMLIDIIILYDISKNLILEILYDVDTFITLFLL